MILLGIIPLPSKPKITMNSYIQPLVNDLLTLWNSMVMPSAFGSRATLICTSCAYLPAERFLALWDTAY